ncbi:MAG: hypothetical protein ACM35G_02505, partial [Planctomycetaceae bacterium]
MLRKPLALAIAFASLAFVAPALLGQSPNCDQTPPTVAQTPLPTATGAIPPAGDMTLGGNSSYLYVLTQWGIARVSLANPANPSGYNQIVVGREGGASVGIIPILCDCHQGWNTFDVAEASDGTARMMGDWQPYAQGGPPPPQDPNNNFSGMPAQVAMATGAGNPGYGQQIDLPARVPLGARVAVANPSAGKYFGYLPVANDA